MDVQLSTPTDQPPIDTELTPSSATQMTTPDQRPFDVLGKMYGDEDFQSAPHHMQRAAVDEVMKNMDPEYLKLSPQDKSDYIDEITKGVPHLDPYGPQKKLSKAYTAVLATLGGAGAEMIPGAAATGPLAPTLGVAAGLAAAHGIDRQLGIREPISTAGGAAGETVKDLYEGAFNVAAGSLLGPLVRGMNPGPEGRALMESAHNMGVTLPAETIEADNPLVGTISSALRTLPASKQVALSFDQKTADQLLKYHKSLLESGDVSMNLEQYGNAIQKHLDDFVRDNFKMSTGQALQFKNAILSRHGSPLSYEELGQNVQGQTKAYFEKMGKAADDLYDHAQNSFDPDFAAPLKAVTEKAGKMHLEALQSKPQFQNSTTNSLLKDLSGASDIEKMVAQRNTEIQQTTADFIAQGIDPNNPSIKSMIPKPVSQEEINHFLDNRTMPLSKVIRLNSDLGKAIRNIDQSYGFGAGQTSGFGTLDSGLLKQVHKAVQEDISGAFSMSSPEAQKAHDAARAFYKFYMGETDNKALQSVLKSQTPETIYQGLVKPGNTSSIEMARRSLPPEGFKDVQNRFVHDFMDTGIDPDSGQTNPISGAFVRKQIQKWTPDTINRVLDPKTSAELYKLPEQLDSLPDSLAENPFFKKILNGAGGPSVIDSLYRKGGTSNVRSMMDAMDPEGQKLMRQSFLARLLKLDTHEQISGNAMDSARNNFGQDMLDLMFKTPEEQKKVGDFINVVYRQRKNLAASQNPSQTGMAFMAARLFKQFIDAPVKAAVQLGGAESIAKLYYSKAMQKYLTEGALPIGKRGTDAIANVIGGLIEGGGDESKNQR